MKTRLILLVLLVVPAVARGQTEPARGTAQAPEAPVPASPAAPLAAASGDFAYAIDGRRDPFMNLIGTGTAAQPTQRGEGAAAFTFDEISVRGVIESRGSLIAVIQGANNKTFVVHTGDRLADGVVTAVTAEGIVVLQDVRDPQSQPPQREVTKLLRSLEGAKE